MLRAQLEPQVPQVRRALLVLQVLRVQLGQQVLQVLQGLLVLQVQREPQVQLGLRVLLGQQGQLERQLQVHQE